MSDNFQCIKKITMLFIITGLAPKWQYFRTVICDRFLGLYKSEFSGKSGNYFPRLY